jgi:uncharacterized protein (DUF2252 family)
MELGVYHLVRPQDETEEGLGKQRLVLLLRHQEDQVVLASWQQEDQVVLVGQQGVQVEQVSQQEGVRLEKGKVLEVSYWR